MIQDLILDSGMKFVEQHLNSSSIQTNSTNNEIFQWLTTTLETLEKMFIGLYPDSVNINNSIVQLTLKSITSTHLLSSTKASIKKLEQEIQKRTKHLSYSLTISLLWNYINVCFSSTNNPKALKSIQQSIFQVQKHSISPRINRLFSKQKKKKTVFHFKSQSKLACGPSSLGFPL